VKHGEAAAAVDKLSPKKRDTGDRIFNVLCDGDHVIGWTKMSRRPSGEDLSHNLEGLMVRQLQVTKPFWRELAGCTKGRSDYLALRDHAGCEPRGAA